MVESDHERCARPRRPYSTFKLANALIAVDVGVLGGPDAEMTWDRDAIPDQRDWPDTWRRPHTLRSGMAVSAVPYFRTLARTLGEDLMRAGLAKLEYGNQSMAGGLDRFWLAGGLRISAAEQLAFVERLARDALAVSPHAQATVRAITELGRDSRGRVLHGKTGAGRVEQGTGLLVWQVGWVDGADAGAIVPYAAWLEATGTVDEVRARRDARLRTALEALDLFAP